MANSLTDAEKATIVEMMNGMTIDGLALHLDSVDASISTAINTKIQAAVVAWDAVEAKFVRIEPNLKNFGAKVDYDRRKQQLRAKVGKWLQMNPSAYSGGSVLQRS